MPWIKFKARPAVSNALSHEVMHELSRCLPVGQRHGVSSGSFVPLQLVLVVLPMWPQHLGHVACSFGVGPQVVAGLQQTQATRGHALQHAAWGIPLDDFDQFDWADAGIQPMWKPLLQLGKCFGSICVYGQRGSTRCAAVVRNGGRKPVVQSRSEQGRFAPSGMANGPHARHAGVIDHLQSVQAALQAPGPDGDAPGGRLGPVLKNRTFSLGRVWVKSQLGSIEPSQGNVMTQDARCRFVAHHMRPACIRAEQHWARGIATWPGDGEVPADPSRCTNADAPNLQFTVALHKAVSALRLNKRILRQEAPKQGLESCEVRRRMRRRGG